MVKSFQIGPEHATVPRHLPSLASYKLACGQAMHVPAELFCLGGLKKIQHLCHGFVSASRSVPGLSVRFGVSSFTRRPAEKRTRSGPRRRRKDPLEGSENRPVNRSQPSQGQRIYLSLQIH